MITLPESPAPAMAVPTLMDFGAVLRPPTGAGLLRIDRLGNRFRWDFVWPPMVETRARLFRAQLLAAREEGLRIAVPLLGITQGLPGTPLVSGGANSGKLLDLKGLRAGYVAREGYWLTVIDTAGVHYLHMITATAVADASGNIANLAIIPALRAPLADGDTVLLEKPLVEGMVVSDVAWEITPDRLVRLSVSIEEAA